MSYAERQGQLLLYKATINPKPATKSCFNKDHGKMFSS